MTADLSNASSISIKVKSDGGKGLTVFSYDKAEGMVSGQTKNKGKECKRPYVEGPLSLDEGALTADIYIDRSLVEAFFNESRAISIRSYSEFDFQAIGRRIWNYEGLDSWATNSARQTGNLIE